MADQSTAPLGDHPPIPAPHAAAKQLAGRTGWVMTDGKAGMDVQALGLAHALGLDVTLKHVAPTGLARLLAPYGPVPGDQRAGKPGSPITPPWPDVAIATGRLSIPYLNELHRASGGTTFRVVLQDPKTSTSVADVMWVPAHDRRRGERVITTLTPPHSFSAERLAALRAELPETLRALPGPRCVVVLGGPNAVYKLDAEDAARLARRLAALAPSVGSFAVTPSRRTPPELLAAVRTAIGDRPAFVWDGEGANPYPHMLAAADLLVVTGDSVNMTGEACATGRPVYVFEPKGGSPKFRRFHDALRAYGATRPLTDDVPPGESWTYVPLDATQDIAVEVARRFTARNS